MTIIQPIINYYSGSILNRLNEVDKKYGKTYKVYDQHMMARDMGQYIYQASEPKVLTLKENNNAKYIYEGDIILNLMTGECVQVSKAHDGSILPYNYTHIEVDKDYIYPPYLMYWFNASPYAKVQLQQFKQGGSLVKKITHKQLQQLKIDIPRLERQYAIGNLAVKRTKLKYLKQKRETLMDLYLSERLFKEEQ